MNLVDLGVIGLVAFAAYRGWHRGFIGQLFEFGGGFIGLLIGVAIAGEIAEAFTDQAGPSAALVAIATVFVMLSLGQAAGYLVGHRFGAVARRAQLGGAFDSFLGVALSVGITFIAFWLIGSLFVQGPSKDLARALRKSQTLKVMNDLMPPPPNVLAYIRQYLNTSGFPQVFEGLPRPIGEPAKLPSQREALAAGQKAQGSMVRVVVPACGGTQLGSGWIAAPETVVTNAHVVSGGDEVIVQDPADRVATVVVFDPRTDIAVLHVEGLAGAPLRLDTEVKQRGEKGATLGYPGTREGQLVIKRAAVQAEYPAVGRDIYGRDTVERDVYEMHAAVRQGDSGGPFVLANGDVAGVVFAAATTDEDTGYALTGAEVADEIRAGTGKTSEVSTGRCTH